jgi:predicted nucleic acid-binding protein
VSGKRLFRPHRIRIDRCRVTYLVDASVLSEATKPAPNSSAIEWLGHNERAIAIDPVILSENRFGIHRLSAEKRRRRRQTWFDEGVARIVCVPWVALTGFRWAKILAELRKSDKSMPIKGQSALSDRPRSRLHCRHQKYARFQNSAREGAGSVCVTSGTRASEATDA